MHRPPIELPWDSHHFGHSIARWDEGRPDPDRVGQLRAWMRGAGVECTYILIDADATDSLRALEEVGASLTDVRFTLRHTLMDLGSTTDDTRAATVDDLPRLVEIARTSHRDGRFHADRRLDAERSDELYETWIRRSVAEGFADAAFVLDGETSADGYVTCAKVSDETTELSLIAVAPDQRGRGAGRSLVAAALRWSTSVGASEMTVVTQGRNVGAIRLYESCGFTASRVQLWYHVWSDPVAGSNA